MKWGKVGNFGESSVALPNVPNNFIGDIHVKNDEKVWMLPMFLGEYEHTIDAKGRIAVPAKFRLQMDRGAVVSKGMGICLSVYTTAHWEQRSAELVAGMSSDDLRDFERRIYPSASEIDLDAQGRMVIPAKLRTYAHLSGEVTVAGVRDHFEIWDRAAWQAYQEQLDAEGSSIPF